MTKAFRYINLTQLILNIFIIAFEQSEIYRSNKTFCVYFLEEIMIARYVDGSENMLFH